MEDTLVSHEKTKLAIQTLDGTQRAYKDLKRKKQQGVRENDKGILEILADYNIDQETGEALVGGERTG